MQNVEHASQEVHVLTPTRYEAPLTKRNVEDNQKAEDRNMAMMVAQPEEEKERKEAEDEGEWERRQRAMVEVIRIFGRARMED